MPPTGDFGRLWGMAQASRSESCRSCPIWRSIKALIDDGISRRARSKRRMISRAISSEASSAQCSAVLNATTRSGSLYWAGHQVGDDGFEVSLLDIGLRECGTRFPVIVDDEIKSLVWPWAQATGSNSDAQAILHKRNHGLQ